MSQRLDQQFGPVRALLWPIHHHELRKFLPMVLMMFLICFNYTILRNMKDSLVVTASGAEVIPFIKVWVMLPTAILLTWIFTMLSQRYSQERVFYIMISLFLICFGLFGFVLYPLRESLHPNLIAASLQTMLPAGFKGLIAMCCNWTFTCFYVMCELWSTSIMTVLFWGLANEVTTLNEARRFYGAFGVSAALSSIISGQVANVISSKGVLNWIPFGNDPWEQTMMVLILTVIVLGCATMVVFRWMSKNVLTDASFDEFHYAKKALKAKGRLSMKDSLNYLSNSKYLSCIAIIVIAYNLVIHMTEVVWKDQLAHLYPSTIEYNIFMNNVTSVIGILAMITALFTSRIIDRIGWTRTALITPTLMAVSCVGLFSFLLFQEQWAPTVLAFVGTTPLIVAVFFGAVQITLSKAAKYSVFDATKEMAFIPLGHELKLRGKAAIDGVGSRLGKSGGAIMHQGLLMVFATVSASAAYVAVILAVVILLWIIATRSLGRQFNALQEKKVDPGVTVVQQPQLQT